MTIKANAEVNLKTLFRLTVSMIALGTLGACAPAPLQVPPTQPALSSTQFPSTAVPLPPSQPAPSVTKAVFTVTSGPLSNILTPQTNQTVTGFVKIADGRTMTGAKAGTTIQVKVEFGASSPFADVREMRVRDTRFRKCFSEAELSQVQWEPITAQKTYGVDVVINFTSFDVSVQYRDGKGNLSQVYCADLAVEGMP